MIIQKRNYETVGGHSRKKDREVFFLFTPPLQGRPVLSSVSALHLHHHLLLLLFLSSFSYFFPERLRVHSVLPLFFPSSHAFSLRPPLNSSAALLRGGVRPIGIDAETSEL
ncbi:hypothetical protein Taro_017929 [Colocasia esculenta]|uniref:Uncharacterized protein n=1 Tax=Colocasia esculenta TaxID=4460 RepID=A0A843UHE0_COLES|nr:hypothetical protein [Colocasia esculenta]